MADTGPRRLRPHPRPAPSRSRDRECLRYGIPPRTRTRRRKRRASGRGANGWGGYASTTIAGKITRRYHGFLIAALPPPLGRMVVLNDLEVDIEREDGSVVNIHQGAFRGLTLDMGLPS